MRFVTGSIHSLLNMPPRFWAAFFVVTVAACASRPPELPYPAFIQSNDLNNIYLATMPGVYAKQLAGDPKTRRTSNRIDLPPGWQGTTGGAPGKALEIFVLTGDLDVGDVRLGNGGYAHVPPGTFGFNLPGYHSCFSCHYRRPGRYHSRVQVQLGLDRHERSRTVFHLSGIQSPLFQIRCHGLCFLRGAFGYYNLIYRRYSDLERDR